MIYEMRTYTLKPRSIPEVLKRFGEAYDKRKSLSPLFAFWYTEIGPLNQIIHVWPYKDVAERTRIREEAVKGGNWPPKIREFITHMQSDIYYPLVDVPAPGGKVGPFFEMRTYTYSPGDTPKIKAIWEKALPARQKFSPIVGCWYSDIGALNSFVHIWPYGSMNERMDTRKKATDAGIWPPKSGEGDAAYTLLTQETKILLAAPFSPLQ
ncbi:MAG TPA: NIPSNAP family protein [Burkholderiales bacterium]|jgi:hypothetical protein|nr:NIPSNAP family protein [Burkholderiales bacterium]